MYSMSNVLFCKSSLLLQRKEFSGVFKNRLHSYQVIEESAYGTTPATPAFQIVRMTSEALKHTRQNTSSNEIRSDRNTADLVQVAGGAEGPINMEFSYETFDDFLESFMYSTWSSDILKNGVTQKSFTIEKTFVSVS